MDISNLIQRLRESGMTQKEIGVAIGCSQSTISQLENGNVGSIRPSYHIVQGLVDLAEQHNLRVAQKKRSPKRRKGDR